MEEFASAEKHIEMNVNARMVFFDLSMKIAVLLKK
jgi:DNA polymerase-3 subunit delta'